MNTRRRTFLKHTAIATAIAPSLLVAKSNAIEKAMIKTGLGEAYGSDFLMGTAISSQTLDGNDRSYLDLIAREFSSVTAENCQKWEELHPEDARWNWATSDKFVDFGIENNKHVLGHCLVWHSQIPESVFKHVDGSLLSATQLQEKMELHINTLVARYKGKVDTWDVVNEAVSDDGYDKWRDSYWHQIMGESFMEHAFRIAHAADPNAELLYNDYNMHIPAKRDFLVNVFKDYLERDVPIHGVGFQAHYSLDEPSLQEIEASLEAYIALGLPIHITELDVDVLPKAFEYMGAEISASFEYSDRLNPFPDGLPEEFEEQLAKRYADLFALFLKHRDSIKRVTLWGTSDGQSWKNNWPVKGRTNYPLLFDRNLKAKEAYHRVIGLKK
jgi:endo-1,4-beta-xylanase